MSHFCESPDACFRHHHSGPVVEDWMDILHEADDFGAGTIPYCGIYVVSEPLSRSLLLNVFCHYSITLLLRKVLQRVEFDGLDECNEDFASHYRCSKMWRDSAGSINANLAFRACNFDGSL